MKPDKQTSQAAASAHQCRWFHADSHPPVRHRAGCIFAAFAGWSLLLPGDPVGRRLWRRHGGTTSAFTAATGILVSNDAAPLGIPRGAHNRVPAPGVALHPDVVTHAVDLVVRNRRVTRFRFGVLTVATTVLGRLHHNTHRVATPARMVPSSVAQPPSPLPGGLAVANNTGLAAAIAAGALPPALALIGLARIPPLR